MYTGTRSRQRKAGAMAARAELGLPAWRGLEQRARQWLGGTARRIVTVPAQPLQQHRIWQAQCRMQSCPTGIAHIVVHDVISMIV